MPSLHVPAVSPGATAGGRLGTTHALASRTQGDACGAFGTKLYMHSCVSGPWSLSTPRPGLELSPLPGAGNRDIDRHLLTFDHLFERIHYPENLVPAQCLGPSVPNAWGLLCPLSTKDLRKVENIQYPYLHNPCKKAFMCP